MLSALPDIGLRSLFTAVSCFHTVEVPNQLSRAFPNVLRAAASILPPAEAARLGKLPTAYTLSAPDHNVRMSPLRIESSDNAEPPFTHSVMSIRSFSVQKNELGDAFRF